MVVGTFKPDAWLEIWARPGRLPASLARPPLVSSWWMAVGFPPGPAPKEDRVVATGMVRTRVLVPVVMAPRLCMGVGNFTLVACGAGPGEGFAGRPDVLLLISCKLKLSPWRRLLADAAPEEA